MAPIINLLEKLELIDAIQRLGVSYHFEGEIDEVLQQIHKHHYTCDVQESDGALYTIALHFRLLRQQGYNILSGKHSFGWLSIYLRKLTLCLDGGRLEKGR